MKYLLTTILLLTSLLISLVGKAQVLSSSLHPDTDIGIKAGGNFQQIAAFPFNPAYSTGFVAGLYAGKHWRKAGFRIEALVGNGKFTSEHPAAYGLFPEKGWNTTAKASFSPLYLNVPAVAQINITKKVLFEIGPQYNYLLSIKDDNGAYTKIFKNDNVLKTGEFCFDLGINAKLPHYFNIGFRYAKGITNVNNGMYYRGYDAWQVNSAQIVLGYKLR